MNIFNTPIYQHMQHTNTSTHEYTKHQQRKTQHDNKSTHQHHNAFNTFNTSKHQPNTAPAHHTNTSAHQPMQHSKTRTHGTHGHINTPAHQQMQHNTTLTHQHTNTPTCNALTHQHVTHAHRLHTIIKTPTHQQVQLINPSKLETTAAPRTDTYIMV